MRKIILIVFLILILTTLIVVGALIFTSPASNDSNGSSAFSDENKEPEVLYAFETQDSFITNMKDSTRFVKADIVLEVPSEEVVTRAFKA